MHTMYRYIVKGQTCLKTVKAYYNLEWSKYWGIIVPLTWLHMSNCQFSVPMKMKLPLVHVQILHSPILFALLIRTTMGLYQIGITHSYPYPSYFFYLLRNPYLCEGCNFVPIPICSYGYQVPTSTVSHNREEMHTCIKLWLYEQIMELQTCNKM